jgi:FtsZ-binding cell division protein ZapB
MGVSGKEIGSLNVEKFNEWCADIESRNKHEFKDYYQPTNGELNKSMIARDSGIGSTQPFKENKELKAAYDDLIARLRVEGILAHEYVSQSKVRVIKESYSSSDQAHRNRQLETAQAQIEVLRRENQQLKNELAKYGKLQKALYGVTEIFPRD